MLAVQRMHAFLICHRTWLLEGTCRMHLPVQASGGSAGRVHDPAKKGARKITPALPLLSAAAQLPSQAAAAAHVPPDLAAAAGGCTDAARQQLQGAFLAMYSTPESKVGRVFKSVWKHSFARIKLCFAVSAPLA